MSEKKWKVGTTVHVLVTEDGKVDALHATVLRHGSDATGKFTEVRMNDADGEIVRVARYTISGYCACPNVG